MELTEVIHSPSEDIIDFNPDLFIAVSGYESRSINIPGKISGLRCRRVVLSYLENYRELNRPVNDRFFVDQGYEMIQLSGSQTPDFESLFSPYSGDTLKVAVDISVMARVWYHGLLKFLHDYTHKSKVVLKIIYSPPLQSIPFKLKSKIQMKSFFMLDDLRVNVKKKEQSALILGLSTEKGLSRQIYKMIKPDKVFLLYAELRDNKQYVENIFINNHELIQQISINNLLGYSIQDTNNIYKKLVNQILPLREDHRVVIVPQGPKIFALMCMILQISYPEIEIQIPVSLKRKLHDREAQDLTAYIDLIFEQE